jgi:hypothetical protein
VIRALEVDMQSDQPVSYSGVGASQAARAQELDMSDPINQLAFHEIGGLRPLLEIIEHLPIKISIGATQILKEILVHPQVQLEVVKVEGFRVLVKLASSPNRCVLRAARCVLCAARCVLCAAANCALLRRKCSTWSAPTSHWRTSHATLA